MRTLILISILLSASLTFAEEKKKTYKKTQQVNFEGSDVDGLARTPDGAYLHQKKGIKFLPLYKVEKNFDKEIKSSVEYLR
jgi:hypothetical protein